MQNLYGRGKASAMTPRHAATLAVAAVMSGQSLNQVIPSLEDRIEDSERGFFRDLTLGSCRWYFRLNALTKMLLKNPFPEEDQDLHALMMAAQTLVRLTMDLLMSAAMRKALMDLIATGIVMGL